MVPPRLVIPAVNQLGVIHCYHTKITPSFTLTLFFRHTTCLSFVFSSLPPLCISPLKTLLEPEHNNPRAMPPVFRKYSLPGSDSGVAAHIKWNGGKLRTNFANSCDPLDVKGITDRLSQSRLNYHWSTRVMRCFYVHRVSDLECGYSFTEKKNF